MRQKIRASLAAASALAVCVVLGVAAWSGNAAPKHGNTFLTRNALMMRAPKVLGPTAVAAFNWGGYAEVYPSDSAQVGAFTYVAGTWTVPHVVCPTGASAGVGGENTLAANWVGIDGYSDLTVEQLGTLEQCFHGHALYQDWYEIYPAGSATASNWVQPGDVITASVRVILNSSGDDEYILRLVDHTTPVASFVTVQYDGAANSSAEWVVERPGYAIGITPLADYVQTSFRDMAAKATAKGWQTSRLYTIDATETYLLARVSPLAHDGFTSTWLGSY